MIKMVRTAQTRSGRFGEALTLSNKVTAHVNTLGPNHPMQSCTLIGGSINSLAWIMDFDDLNDMQQFQSKMDADPEFLEQIRELSTYFVDGSVHEQLYEVEV